MSKYSHGKGSVGVSMSTVRVVNGREVKKRPPRRCNCKKCVHAIIKGECVNCYITGEIAVNEQYCYYYKSNDPEEQVKTEKYKNKRKPKNKKPRSKKSKIKKVK